MDDQSTLPAELAPWADALSVLDIGFAIELGPMVRSLDAAISAHDRMSDDEGDFDGWNGISRRGEIEHLLLSEWAVAVHVPDEFQRRAATRELSYLEPERVASGRRGATCVLLEVGPSQIGVPRLVQLALLVVLQRRASRRRSELKLGLLPDEPGSWLTGPFSELLGRWLRARHASGGRENLDGWLSFVDDPAHAWVAGSAELTRRVGSANTAQIREDSWGPDGVSTARLILRDRAVVLNLPKSDRALRALRRPGSSPNATTHVGDTTAVHGPAFLSKARTLFLRGDDVAELLTVPVVDTGLGRVRRHRMTGRVLAAGTAGRRVLILVERDGVLTVTVVGKPLGRTDEIRASLADVGQTPAKADASVGLGTLHFDRGDLLWDSPIGWVRLSTAGRARFEKDIVTVAAGTSVDAPRICYRASASRPPRFVLPAQSLVFGPDETYAWSDDGAIWHHSEATQTISVTEAVDVARPIRIAGDPALVSVSRAGLIVRLHFADRQRTLTDWSGGLDRPAVHPTLPLIAVRREPDRIEVVDLSTGRRIGRLGVTAPRNVAP